MGSNAGVVDLRRPILRGWLHLGGVIALLAASPLLWIRTRTDVQVAWVLCYVLGVGSMMSVSAVFHRVRWSPQARQRMAKADLAAIYLAISGTYLAIVGLTMHGSVRMVFLLVMAVGTVLGILGSVTGSVKRFLSRDGRVVPRWMSTIPYLLTGWLAVAVMPEIYRGGGLACLSLIVIGGLSYSVGALCYGFRRPRLMPKVFGYHEVFHLCTLVGVGCHFAAIAIALK